jgi:NADPH-dependent curcumin reductase CurA
VSKTVIETPEGQESIQVSLARRPSGRPVAEDFQLRRVRLPDLRDGDVRVANHFVSVDPYMRGRMDDRASYVPPYALDEPMTGLSLGVVSVSESPDLEVGTFVVHSQGWRDVAQGPASDFRRVADLPGVPLSAHLGALGPTGLTAYVGVLRAAAMQPGDTVFVSGAAGAVGSMVGQIARLKGARRVIGSAGSAEKVKTAQELFGYDAVFDYHDAPVLEQLADAAPEGIDVYFDNVGGDHLEAALSAFNYGGRAALCGAISLYDAAGSAPGPRFMENIVYRSLSLRGFLLQDYPGAMTEFLAEIAPLVASGDITYRETFVQGIEHAVDAFLGLLDGHNVGKMLVDLR